MTVYGSPGTEAHRSTRFAATIGGTTAYVYGMARTALVYLEDYWVNNDLVQVSFVTSSAVTATTVALRFLGGAITTTVVYPKRADYAVTIAGDTLTIALTPGQTAWVVVNGEHGEPCIVRVLDPIATPLGDASVQFDGSQTEVAASTTLVFSASYCAAVGGTINIGQQFPIRAGGTAFLEGGSVTEGSFDMSEADNTDVDGHGVLVGTFSTPEAVALLSDFFAKLPYSMLYALEPDFQHSGSRVRGITIAKPPFYAAFGVNTMVDVLSIGIWAADCTGPHLAADPADSNKYSAVNCVIWSCDDAINVSEYVGDATLRNNLLASVAGATYLVGYWPAADYGLPFISTDDTVISMQDWGDGNGVIIQMWSDGEENEEAYVVADYAFEGLRVEGPNTRAMFFYAGNVLYPWGPPGARKGRVTRISFKDVAVETAPSDLSTIVGIDAYNTPHDIEFNEFRVGGDPVTQHGSALVTVRNYLNYFNPLGIYPYDIRFGGRAVTTQVDICNMALGLIGNKAKVTAISPVDGSAEATHCERFLPFAVNALLGMHPWSWATAKIELTPINVDVDDAQTDNDDEAWQWRYEIPNGMVRALSVLPDDATNDYLIGNTRAPVDFCIKRSNEDEELRIYTNQEGAFLRYVVYEDDPNVWDPLFIMALAWHLASLLAGPIIKGEQGHAEAQRCLQRMSQYLAEAKQKDAGERQATLTRKSSLTAGR